MSLPKYVREPICPPKGYPKELVDKIYSFWKETLFVKNEFAFNGLDRGYINTKYRESLWALRRFGGDPVLTADEYNDAYIVAENAREKRMHDLGFRISDKDGKAYIQGVENEDELKARLQEVQYRGWVAHKKTMQELWLHPLHAYEYKTLLARTFADNPYGLTP
jgi:hypothetical protein